MPNIAFTIEHHLSVQEASSRLKNAISDLKSRFGDRIQNLRESWEGNEAHYSFAAMGFQVSGHILVKQDSVQFSGKIPIAAMPFKRKIEDAAKQHLIMLLS